MAGRLLLVVALASGVASCGDDPAGDASQDQSTPTDDPTPAVCEALDSLSTSVRSLQDLEVDRDVLRTLSDDLGQIDAAIRQVADDASDEYGDEVDTVKSSAAGLEQSVKAASATPSSATLSAVGADVRTLGASLETLVSAVGNTC